MAVLGFMGYRLVTGVRVSRSGNGRALVRAIVRGARWRHVWPVPFVLAAVLAIATGLLMVPGLDWGWWTALGGEGNPVFGSSSATSGMFLEWLIPLTFMALLLPALPLFAHAEERIFRSGAEHWSRRRRALKVVQFGLAHALIGIPIGAALALSVGGAYFMAVYLRYYRHTPSAELATLESARAHTVYNGIIVAAVLITVVITTWIA
ncbi:MAG: hypothetical protein WCI22_09180 [Actinomycetota bacterium]